MSPLLLTIPIISAFIGWFTNWIAIKMLFHPKDPIKLAGFKIQGIFPKRQRQFGEKLGKLISDEFLSFSMIEQKISDPEKLKNILPFIESHIDTFLQKKLPEIFPGISMFIGEKTISTLKTAFMNELEDLFPQIMKKYSETLKNELDLEKIVISKVGGFSSDKLELILMQIMSREFKFVEILGGILGFIIGCLQVIITLLA